MKKKTKTRKLLSSKDPKPFRVENPKGRGNVVVVCDHASNRIPKSLGTLGLSKKNLQKHIAWDIGAEKVALQVARALDAPAVMAQYSRLVCDLNRGPHHGQCIRVESDHTKIPGNTGLTAAQKKQRLEEIFFPYHKEVARLLAAKRKVAKRKTGVPLFISIHSFTPKMDGKKRPWHIGVMWNREEKLGRALVNILRRQNPGKVIGANRPYSMKELNVLKDTIGRHAENRGLPYIIVEFRQDLVATPAGARQYAEIFLNALFPIVTDPKTYTLRARVKK